MDQESLKHLEDLEKVTGHIMELLTQAEQDLEQGRAAVDNYNNAHHLNSSHSAKIDEAMRDIQTILANFTNRHNEAVGQIKEAKLEAENRVEDDPNASQ
jgi:hypothetical protein